MHIAEIDIAVQSNPGDTRICNPRSASNCERIQENFSTLPLLCYNKTSTENEFRHLGQNEMAGLKGKSGPPGNMNAFKHGLAAIQKRREEGIPTEHEEGIRRQILDGLIADKGGDDQVSTATRILAEVIASDAAWLMVFNGAIDHIIQNNPKARQNPRGLTRLRGFDAK